MMDKVKEMKHINYNYDDLDCGTKLKRKTAIFQTKTNLNKKRNNNKTFFILEKNNNRKNNEIDFFDNKYFNTIKNFLIDNRLIENNYDKTWQKELNNILPSTDEFSIKEENHIKSDNEKMEIKSKNFIFENDEDVNLKDLSFKFINSNLNCLNFKNDNIEYDDKEENESEDCCSKMTNLYKDVCNSKIINDFLNHP
jgi:hypothetical protein